MWYTLALVGAVAFALNVPLGMWRETMRRFSVGWFVAIHLSVPVVIAARVVEGLPLTAAPLLLALSVLGQVVGSRAMRRSRLARLASAAVGPDLG